MSMQRILETARKLGLPVVVTDSAGREPYVLLPLEQFEAMGRESGVALHTQGGRRESPNLRNGVPPQVGFVESRATSDVRPPTSGDGDLSLEDQFYIEPTDESNRI